MSKEDTIQSSDEAKHEEKKEKERKDKKEKFKPRTKIIVRHLPPSMTEEQFINQISPLPDGTKYYFVRPDHSLDEYSFCRAYILIPNLEDQLLFRDKFDNYIFLDAQGGLEYAAIVEYAPYQKFPFKKHVKELTEEQKAKKESYENDPAYIKFLEKKEKTKKTNLLEFPLEMTEGSSSKKNIVTSTPLLEYIKEKRAEKQRLKEERKKKEIERKKLIAEEKRKKASENSNFKNFYRSISPENRKTNQGYEKKDYNSKTSLGRTNSQFEDSNNIKTLSKIKDTNQRTSNLELNSNKNSYEGKPYSTHKSFPQLSKYKKEKLIDIFKPEGNLFHSIKSQPKKIIELGKSDDSTNNNSTLVNINFNYKHSNPLSEGSKTLELDPSVKDCTLANFTKVLEKPQELKDDLDMEEEKNFSRIYTNSNWGQSSKKFIHLNTKFFYDKPKLVIKGEKEGTKNFQNKSKREEDENIKSRYRDEDNVKTRYRDDDKSRFRDDETKIRYKADRREPIKHLMSYEKVSSKKVVDGKKSYEYQNSKYDQKKSHLVREYENKSYHKDYESKSKDYEHKRQYQDDKRRPKNEWKNSKDAKYKDYESRTKDWEHQGARPRKKPQNSSKKEEEPKKILENRINKSENESQVNQNQEDQYTNPAEKKDEPLKELQPVVNSECEIKSNTSTSSKSESDLNTVKSLDSKSNDSDSTLKEEPIRDPRPERRIRNKDRPSLEIYRPGMGKFSRQRREQEKNSLDQDSPTNSPNHVTLNKTKVKT